MIVIGSPLRYSSRCGSLFPTAKTLVDVGEIAEVKVVYDQPGQMLKLTVPDNWLPEQHIGNSREQEYLQGDQYPRAVV